MTDDRDDREDALQWIGSGDDHMALLPRDPESAYLFWEITTERIARAESTHDSQAPSRLLCRWEVDDGSDSSPSRELTLDARMGRRFVEWLAPAPHRARIGWYASRETFIEIAHSAVVEPPPKQPGVRPVRWVEREESGQYRLEGVGDEPTFPSLAPPSTDESPPSS